jgi:transposase
MEDRTITAVGIDVSKGKSTVAVRRPGGEVVLTPFLVEHDAAGLSSLVKTLRSVGGNIRIVMEHTGMYWRLIALVLKEAGFFISVVNAMLIHDFSDNSLRKVKTDKADSMKIANYALSFWTELWDYSAENETWQMLKMQNRLYLRTKKSSVVLRNGLISLLDQTFPGVNMLFDIQPKRFNGHFKWVDFVKHFWHKDCVAGISFAAFSDAYRKWCAKSGYRFSQPDAEKLHAAARNAVATFPKNDSTKLLIVQAVDSLNAVYDALHILRGEMLRLASLLPEFDVVMEMQGAGEVTGPQLMAEIGDVRRFTHKGALVAFACMDAPPFQSGTFDSKSRCLTENIASVQPVRKNSALTGLFCYAHFHAAKFMLTFFILGLDTYLQVCDVGRALQ